MLTVGELFAGIGGFGLGLERAGMRVAWQCEIDEWRRGILARHWPDAVRYGDVHDLGADTPRVDVLCGGFPCQPVSLAGAGRLHEDERWLWPQFARVIRELRPRYVILENVSALLAGRGASEVFGDLAALGMQFEWDCVPASAVGAPHQRDRVWIVAYPDPDQGRQPAGAQLDSEPIEVATDRTSCGRHPDGLRHKVADASTDGRGPRGPGRSGPGGQGQRKPERTRQDVADPDEGGRARWPRVFGPGWRTELENRCRAERNGRWAVESGVARVAHGVPDWAHRVGALGDSLVPVIPELIGQRIVMWEAEQQIDALSRAAMTPWPPETAATARKRATDA